MASRTHRNDLSQKELEALCAEWQKVLRLSDWRVRVRYATHDKELDCQGWFDAEPRKRQAIIKLQPFKFNSVCRDPLEMTLVHELVHIHLLPLAPDNRPEHTDVALEQAVDALAYALFTTKYPNWKDAYVRP